MDFHQSRIPFYINNDGSMHASIARWFDGKIGAPHEGLMQRKERMKKLLINYLTTHHAASLDYLTTHQLLEFANPPIMFYKVDHILQSIINFLLLLEI
jgi:hypothetical protein